jgi:hypothetical protein
MANQSNPARRSLLLPAAILGAGLLAGSMFSEAICPSLAGAQTVTEPPFNAADQRKQIIEQLKTLNDKVTTLQGRFDKGISVKVTEMPAVVIKDK